MNLTEVFKMLLYLENNQNVIQYIQQEDIDIRMLTNESACIKQL